MKNHAKTIILPSKFALRYNFEMAKFPLYALSGYNKALGVFKIILFVAGKALGFLWNISVKKRKQAFIWV